MALLCPSGNSCRRSELPTSWHPKNRQRNRQLCGVPLANASFDRLPAAPIRVRHRAVGEVRRVPCPPVLTAIIRRHVARFGLGPGGRLFAGERNKAELPVLTINRVWRQARAAVFTPAVDASPLAETPYDLRHAAVSTMLNAGISPTDVAEIAGQSPEVLWRNYAKCLDGGWPSFVAGWPLATADSSRHRALHRTPLVSWETSARIRPRRS
jgi:hypothetical protein